MLKKLNFIKNFGVFQNYQNNESIDNFKDFNIIYGWNYSGKTTISRLLHCIEKKELHQDYQNAHFNIMDSNNISITNENIKDISPLVRVFNIDFISNNLKWNGEEIAPILLLGEDSIKIQEEIDQKKKKLIKANKIKNKINTSYTRMEKSINETQSSIATQIKIALNIVEAYDKRHLNPIYSEVYPNTSSFILSDEVVSNKLTEATSSSDDKLPLLDMLIISPQISDLTISTKKLLIEVPSFSKTIDHLVKNPDIANWVETGIYLHKNEKNCSFCNNTLTLERLSELRAHFSEDLKTHKENLEKLSNQIKNDFIKLNYCDYKEIYPSLRKEYSDSKENLEAEIKIYNSNLDILKKETEKKIIAPFVKIDEISQLTENTKKVKDSIIKINNIIKKHNDITNSFDETKKNAILSVKRHFTAQTIEEKKLTLKTNLVKNNKARHNKFENFISNLSVEISILEAQINNAQKGREKLNAYISNLLGYNDINIEVEKRDGQDKYVLKRKGEKAINLSEGEKSAIAFAYFLTKLLENENLSETIVFIDDPISSLDSNHIFQINAFLKVFFFEKSEKWVIKCKQLFISTHNFEFFSLLKELPSDRANKKLTEYYYVRRLNNSESLIERLPNQLKIYKSEYHFLFAELNEFYKCSNKENFRSLMHIPNALRRFVELYTYAKIPNNQSVDARSEEIFGIEKSKRILKVLHYFSHSNRLEGLTSFSEYICDIENAVKDLMIEIEKDSVHYRALLESLPS